MKNNIYFDNSATTFVRKEVFEYMKPFYEGNYGNASSVYELGRLSKKAITEAREKVAKVLNADANEIFFTAGGTESDNWAIRGVCEANLKKGNHIITTCIEHHAVLHTCKYLEKNGFEVTYLSVDKFGLIDLEELKKAIRPTTILITIMFANNEIGTIQPIAEIGKIAKENGVIFHTDAVQAVGSLKVDVNELNIDLLSLSAHKMYGPKGVGALFIRKGVKISPLIHGGAQERNRRAGTENVAGIVGLGEAISLSDIEREETSERLIKLREKVISGIVESIPNVIINGHREKRLPGNVNISFEFIEGESLLLLLDMKGIYASSGSACTSGSLDPSHVLLSIGLPHKDAHGSLRISLGKFNTEEEVDTLLKELPPIVLRLREMSPLYNKK